MHILDSPESGVVIDTKKELDDVVGVLRVCCTNEQIGVGSFVRVLRTRRLRNRIERHPTDHYFSGRLQAPCAITGNRVALLATAAEVAIEHSPESPCPPFSTASLDPLEMDTATQLVELTREALGDAPVNTGLPEAMERDRSVIRLA